MIIGTSKVIINTDYCFSLKEKRSIIQRIKRRVRNKYNVSIAETDFQNEWHDAQLGIAVVSNDSKHADSTINKVINFIEEIYPGIVDDWDLEIDNR